MATITPEIERRRHPRMQLQMSVTSICMDPSGDMMDTLHTVDISRSGLGAISHRPYYPGQRVVVSLPMSTDAGHRNFYATIVRCRQVEEGFRLGLHFDNSSAGAWYGPQELAAAA